MLNKCFSPFELGFQFLVIRITKKVDSLFYVNDSQSQVFPKGVKRRKHSSPQFTKKCWQLFPNVNFAEVGFYIDRGKLPIARGIVQPEMVIKFGRKTAVNRQKPKFRPP